jgi:hypothetical protein
VFFWVFGGLMSVFEPPRPGSAMIDYFFPFTDVLLLRVPAGSLVPVGIMIAMFYVCGIFYQIVGVLTSRLYIHIIPNKNRNGVYSLFPTIILLLAIPQITFFGWLIAAAGIPLSLLLLGVVSSIGVIMIRAGLSESAWLSRDVRDEHSKEIL